MKTVKDIPSRIPNEYRSLEAYLAYYKEKKLAGDLSDFTALFNAIDLEKGNDYQLNIIGNLINRSRLYENKFPIATIPTPEQLTEIYRRILKATIIKEVAQYGSVDEIYECVSLALAPKTRLNFNVIDFQNMSISIIMLFKPDPIDLLITKYLGIEIVPLAMGRELNKFGVLLSGSMVGRQSVGESYVVPDKTPVEYRIKEVGFYSKGLSTHMRTV